MNWNQEELEQWALAAKQKEEDNLALQKYTRADEAKIKDITLQIEKLTTLVSEKKNELDNEVTETQSKQKSGRGMILLLSLSSLLLIKEGFL